MSELLHFKTRDEFRIWLTHNCMSGDGVWLLFGKTKELKTLKAGEALEEALCFGWIDGLMKRVDDHSYMKYFSARRKGSKWSEKNKSLIKSLETRGLMTDFGREKVKEAKSNGQWDHSAVPSAVTSEQIESVAGLLKEYEQAYTNFQGMPPSVQKTYARAYFDAKTDAGRIKRLAWIVDRLACQPYENGTAFPLRHSFKTYSILFSGLSFMPQLIFSQSYSSSPLLSMTFLYQ